jgi:ankyrin repeat protein
MTNLLLESGANPNDGECLYHSSEASTSAHLELLLSHGVKIMHPNEFARHLDFEHPEWIRKLVAYFDPAELPMAIPHALQRGRSTECIKILIDTLPDLDRLDQWGRRAYPQAYRIGRMDVCELLAAVGASTELSESDRAIGMIARGETPVATPELIASLDAEVPPMIVVAAEHNHLRGVKALLTLGVNPNALGQNGDTALHQACWHGFADIAIALIEAGANPKIVDAVHGGNCFGWTIHGSRFSRSGQPQAEYVRIIDALAPTDLDEFDPEGCSSEVIEAVRRYTQAP